MRLGDHAGDVQTEAETAGGLRPFSILTSGSKIRRTDGSGIGSP